MMKVTPLGDCSCFALICLSNHFTEFAQIRTIDKTTTTTKTASKSLAFIDLFNFTPPEWRHIIICQTDQVLKDREINNMPKVTQRLSSPG